MPTVGERLATLEQIARDNRARINEIHDLLDSGGDVSYERSVRGRLHEIETTLAGMVLRRNFGLGFAKGWVQVVFVVCAVATAAAAWYAVLSGG